jgi:hypothetical protein
MEEQAVQDAKKDVPFDEVVLIGADEGCKDPNDDNILEQKHLDRLNAR